ncbi:MAG: hypothetical protein HY600_01880 [Candidatus Omnitrophica bacterium]|nr:hypothetical protein [Candidatus Omnitrophota bacterium]
MPVWKQVLRELRNPAIVKGYLAARGRSLVWTIPATWLVGAILHIYMMAFWYDGYSVSAGAHVIGQGNLLWGTLEWSVVPFLLFFAGGYLRAAGTGAVVAYLRTAPSGLGMAIRAIESHVGERPVQEWLLINIGAVSLLSQLFKRPYGSSMGFLLLAVAAIAIAAFAVQRPSARSAQAPIYRQGWFLSLCVGIGLVLGSTRYGVLGGLLLGGGLFLRWKRRSGGTGPGSRLALWALFAVGVWLLWKELLWADDGGWVEFRSSNPDGNPLDWAKDEGGKRVVSYGAAAGGVSAGSGAAGDYAGYTAAQTAGPSGGTQGQSPGAGGAGRPGPRWGGPRPGTPGLGGPTVSR